MVVTSPWFAGHLEAGGTAEVLVVVGHTQTGLTHDVAPVGRLLVNTRDFCSWGIKGFDIYFFHLQII